MINDADIRCFLLAAEVRSIASASKMLFISPSTYSRNLSRLEAELDVVLLDRSTKSITLTRAGEYAYEAFKNILDDLDTAIRSISDINAGIMGSLSIGVVSGQMLNRVMQLAFSSFKAVRPNVSLSLSRMTNHELGKKLMDGMLDAAMTRIDAISSIGGLDWTPICKLRSLLVIPATHPFAQKKGLMLADFSDSTLIYTGGRSRANESRFYKELCEKTGFTGELREARDENERLLWLEAGFGIGLSNRDNMACNSPVLTEVEIDDLGYEQFVLAWKRSNSNPVLPVFIQCLKKFQPKDSQGAET